MPMSHGEGKSSRSAIRLFCHTTTDLRAIRPPDEERSIVIACRHQRCIVRLQHHIREVFVMKSADGLSR